MLKRVHPIPSIILPYYIILQAVRVVSYDDFKYFDMQPLQGVTGSTIYAVPLTPNVKRKHRTLDRNKSPSFEMLANDRSGMLFAALYNMLFS